MQISLLFWVDFVPVSGRFASNVQWGLAELWPMPTGNALAKTSCFQLSITFIASGRLRVCFMFDHDNYDGSALDLLLLEMYQPASITFHSVTRQKLSFTSRKTTAHRYMFGRGKI